MLLPQTRGALQVDGQERQGLRGHRRTPRPPPGCRSASQPDRPEPVIRSRTRAPGIRSRTGAPIARRAPVWWRDRSPGPPLRRAGSRGGGSHVVARRLRCAGGGRCGTCLRWSWCGRVRRSEPGAPVRGSQRDLGQARRAPGRRRFQRGAADTGCPVEECLQARGRHLTGADPQRDDRAEAGQDPHREAGPASPHSELFPRVGRRGHGLRHSGAAPRTPADP